MRGQKEKIPEISENWMEEVDRSLNWFEKLCILFVGSIFRIKDSRVVKVSKKAYMIFVHLLVGGMFLFLLFLIFLLISLKLSGN